MKEYRVKEQPTHEEQLQMIEEGEQRFHRQLDALTDRLCRLENLKMIGLTGPTCSGKTTAAGMITSAFAQQGRRVQMISIDDFYYDKAYLAALTERKGMTTLDYDSEDTIDVALLRRCVEALRRGETVRLPRFNFVTGDREEGELITPEEKDVFLFEGIQVLYPGVDEILCGEGYQSVLIAPQTALRVGESLFTPNEIRLLRRLVRDVYFRDTSPAFTFYIWESVRANEERSIFPHVDRCNYSVDSTMPYELGVLKPFLERDLSTVPRDNGFYKTAREWLERIAPIATIPHSLLPEKTLYKEFIAL